MRKEGRRVGRAWPGPPPLSEHDRYVRAGMRAALASNPDAASLNFTPLQVAGGRGLVRENRQQLARRSSAVSGHVVTAAQVAAYEAGMMVAPEVVRAISWALYAHWWLGVVPFTQADSRGEGVRFRFPDWKRRELEKRAAEHKAAWALGISATNVRWQLEGVELIRGRWRPRGKAK